MTWQHPRAHSGRCAGNPGVRFDWPRSRKVEFNKRFGRDGAFVHCIRRQGPCCVMLGCEEPRRCPWLELPPSKIAYRLWANRKRVRMVLMILCLL